MSKEREQFINHMLEIKATPLLARSRTKPWRLVEAYEDKGQVLVAIYDPFTDRCTVDSPEGFEHGFVLVTTPPLYTLPATVDTQGR